MPLAVAAKSPVTVYAFIIISLCRHYAASGPRVRRSRLLGHRRAGGSAQRASRRIFSCRSARRGLQLRNGDRCLPGGFGDQLWFADAGASARLGADALTDMNNLLSGASPVLALGAACPSCRRSVALPTRCRARPRAPPRCRNALPSRRGRFPSP